MEDALHFIAANYLLLLLGCAALFVLGLVLYIVGKLVQHKGERLMAEAMYAPEDVQGFEPLPFNPQVPEAESWGEYAPPIYPPVEPESFA